MNNKETLEALEERGFQAYAVHFRRYIESEIQQTGGETHVHITDKEDRVYVTTVARCSNKDQFNRKRGFTIALGRAIKELNKMEAAI